MGYNNSSSVMSPAPDTGIGTTMNRPQSASSAPSTRAGLCLLSCKSLCVRSACTTVVLVFPANAGSHTLPIPPHIHQRKRYKINLRYKGIAVFIFSRLPRNQIYKNQLGLYVGSCWKIAMKKGCSLSQADVEILKRTSDFD